MAMSERVAAPSRRRGSRRWLGYVGLVFLGLALTAFIYELLIALNSGSYRVIAAGELWFRLNPSSLNLAQAVTQRYLHPDLWNPMIISILQWPAWSILGAPGALLAILFGPWNRKKG